MQVCAPGMIARSPTERIKTDKRDAMKLARLHAAGQLVCVHVPSVEHEPLRDLARRREDARQDLMRAKHRIGKFLLRRELYYPGRGRAWTREHRAWLASLRFADAASEATFADYLHAHDTLAARPRRPRPHDRHARARVLVGRDDRAAAVPARHRHARRVRAARRDLRLPTLHAAHRAERLPRTRPLGEQQR
jgi:Transposase